MATGIVRLGTVGASGASLGDPAGRVWHEDVYDTFTDISPWEHPVISMLPSDTTDAVQVNWPVKRLNPIKTTLDAKAEGYDFTADGDAVWQERAILNNYIENFTFPVLVSSRSRAVDMLGGGSDEFYLRAAEATKEMGRNIEVRFFDDTFAVDANTGFIGTGTANPTLAKPLMQLIFQARGATGLNFAPTQASGVNAFRSDTMARVDKAAGASLTDETAEIDQGTYPEWAQTRLTETMVTQLMQAMHGRKDTGGCNPDTLVCPPANFAQVGSFGVGPGTGSGYGDMTVNVDASLEKIMRVVRWYRSQFGLTQVIESRWLDQATNTGALTSMEFGTTPRGTNRNCGLVWAFERKFLSVCWFQKPELIKLAKTGLRDKGLVWSECTFKLLHPQAAGVIIGVNSV